MHCVATWVALITPLYELTGCGKRKRRSPTLRGRIISVRLTEKVKKEDIHGGWANGMPRKLVTDPVVVPTTIALSSFMIG